MLNFTDIVPYVNNSVEVRSFECVWFTEGDFKGERRILKKSSPTIVGKGNKGIDVQICEAMKCLKEEHQVRNLSRSRVGVSQNISVFVGM